MSSPLQRFLSPVPLRRVPSVDPATPQQVNEEEASQARVDATRANKTKKGGKKQRGAADASPMRAVAGEGGGEVVAEEGDGGKKKNKKNAEGDGMKGVVMKREGAAVKNDGEACVHRRCTQRIVRFMCSLLQ